MFRILCQKAMQAAKGFWQHVVLTFLYTLVGWCFLFGKGIAWVWGKLCSVPRFLWATVLLTFGLAALALIGAAVILFVWQRRLLLRQVTAWVWGKLRQGASWGWQKLHDVPGKFLVRVLFIFGMLLLAIIVYVVILSLLFGGLPQWLMILKLEIWQLGGAAVALLTLGMAYSRILIAEKAEITARNVANTAQKAEISNRFARIMEMLGREKQDGEPNIEVRIGGLWDLDKLMREVPTEYHTIGFRELYSYLRNNAPDAQNKQGKWYKKFPQDDVQVALRLLVLRKKWGREPAIQLPRRRLSWGRLKGANLQRADLQGANLQKADLTEANLQRARLQGATLEGARLNQADFSKARNLTKGQLLEAKFEVVTLPDMRKMAREEIEDTPAEELEKNWPRDP